MNFSSNDDSLPNISQIEQGKKMKKKEKIYKRTTRSKKEKIEEGDLKRKMF